jgi:hypothetical protein
MNYAGNEDWRDAHETLSQLHPPKGRKTFTVNQLLAVAQVEATLALVAEQRTANEIDALKLGYSPLDEDSEDKIAAIKTPASQRRARRVNQLRRRIKAALGLSVEEE